MKEFPERGRQGCSRAVQADRPQLPILTGLVPFSHGNCHGVKCPGCTPIPNSHPDAGVHIWKEHPPPQKPWDRGWCQPGTRLSSGWSGVGHPSICPAIHTRPQGGAFPKKMCFSVISPPHSLAMGRWVLSNELLGASHSCSYKYIDLGFFFLFLLNTMHPFSLYIYIYIIFLFFFGCYPLPVDKMRWGRRWEGRGGGQHKNKREAGPTGCRVALGAGRPAGTWGWHRVVTAFPFNCCSLPLFY